MNINLLSGLTLLLLVIGAGFGLKFAADNQELRGRAATPEITFVSFSKGDTAQTTNATSLLMKRPDSVQAGDVMVALLQADYGHIGGALPDGWVFIDELNEKDDLTLHAYYKIATATEPIDYHWSIINTDDTEKAKKNQALGGGTIFAFRGVDNQHPIAAHVINPETADPALSECPSVMSPVLGGMLLCAYATDDPPTNVIVPTSMTRVSNFVIRNNDGHTAAYEKLTKAGETGKRVATLAIPQGLAGKTTNDVAIGIVLSPGTSGSPQPSSYSLGGSNNASPSAASVAPPSLSPSVSSPAAIPTPVTTNTDERGLIVQFLTLFLALLKSLFAFL